MGSDSEASRRMHDYLLNKQRRKEEYWLRKYGRVRGDHLSPDLLLLPCGIPSWA